MVGFGAAIFTGAFLLFMVQPLMAKFILPWFGGSPAVWTTCLLFFQVLLVAGYGYAHWSMCRLRLPVQVVVHLTLVGVALLLLPITPGDRWKPPDGSMPVARILLLLSACLGLPYMVLAATSPLLQGWFSRVYPGAAPYRLYALSNAGSLLALVSYPFLVEPNLTRHAQAGWWSAGLGLFALLALGCGLQVWRQTREVRPNASAAPVKAVPGSPNASQDGTTPGTDLQPALKVVNADEATGPDDRGHSQPQAGTPPMAATSDGAGLIRTLWWALPACGSVLLLAVTNKICQDIAVVPFLWVLPLSLYLLTFILSFDNPRWYQRRIWWPALALVFGMVLWLMLGETVSLPDRAMWRPVRWLLAQAGAMTLFKTIALYLATLFVGCMVCHGELYRLRPPPAQLTRYYLHIAAGGALGGVFVAVIAPRVFKGYFELETGIGLLAALVVAVWFVDGRSPLRGGRRPWAWAVVTLALAGLSSGLGYHAVASNRGAVEVVRTFYGVLKVEEFGADEPETHARRLMHGTTTHGLQYLAPHKRNRPASYYTRTSGAGRAMRALSWRSPVRVGVVGLGTGTMAAWGKAGDYFRFYEINPTVVELAYRQFSYLTESPASIEVVPGDARLALEREPAQGFDLLALDAFSGDAIPVHLLTREAFAIYLRHVQPQGILAVHISNHFLDLEPIIRRVADHFSLRAVLIRDEEREWFEDDEEGIAAYGSDWVLLSRDAACLDQPEITEAATDLSTPAPTIKLWTDDQSDLFRILILDKDSWLAWLRRRVVPRLVRRQRTTEPEHAYGPKASSTCRAEPAPYALRVQAGHSCSDWLRSND